MTPKQANAADKKMIQLNQKLLHYRSEVVKQARQLEEQHKRIADQDLVITGLTDRLEELVARPNLSAESNDENVPSKKMEELPIEKETLHVCTYFSYSVMAPYQIEEDEDEPFVIKGHFIIENVGNLPLNEPIICLSFNKPNLANLSGKIERSTKKRTDFTIGEGVDAWTFIEDKADVQAKKTGHFWLKPAVDTIPPQSSLSFSDFEIVVPKRADARSISLQIKGYVYGANLVEGKASLNAISLALS